MENPKYYGKIIKKEKMYTSKISTIILYLILIIMAYYSIKILIKVYG